MIALAGFEGAPHLGVVPAADGSPPVGHINAVWVAQKPVVLLDQERPRVLADGAVHVMENGGLVPVHLHLVEPGPRLSEEHSGRDLKGE